MRLKIKDVIKTIILSLSLLSPLGNYVFADQAVYVSADEAVQILKALKNGDKVLFFCAPCGDKKSTEETIRSIRIGKSGNSSIVYINDKEIDLAYLYILNRNRWQNAALYAGVKVTNVPDFIDPDDLISITINPDSNNIISSRLAGTWEKKEPLSEELNKKGSKIEAVRFVQDHSVINQFTGKIAKDLKDNRVYTAGKANFLIKNKAVNAVYLLTTYAGIPTLVLKFSGDTEMVYVSMAIADENDKDILFIGGDRSSEPYTPMFRSYNRNVLSQLEGHSPLEDAGDEDSQNVRRDVKNTHDRRSMYNRRLDRYEADDLIRTCHVELTDRRRSRRERNDRRISRIIEALAERWPEREAVEHLSEYCPETVRDFMRH